MINGLSKTDVAKRLNPDGLKWRYVIREEFGFWWIVFKAIARLVAIIIAIALFYKMCG